jgi:hypothetical protein
MFTVSQVFGVVKSWWTLDTLINVRHKWHAIGTLEAVKGISAGINKGSPKPHDLARPSSCLY